MKRFKKEVRGSISLFLSMIMLLLVILEGFLIDGSKVLAGKMMMSAAGDLTLNAALTYYDDALRRVYGLFATCKTEAELTENLEAYFRETIGDAAGTEAGSGYTDNLVQFIEQSITGGWDNEEAGKLLDMSLASFQASGLENATLADEYVIKNQILEYMKYRGPASLGYGMLEKLFAFKNLKKEQQVMEKKLEYEETMSEVQKACENAYDAIVAYNKILQERLTTAHVEAESEAVNKAIYETVVAVFALNCIQNKGDHKATHRVNGSQREFDADWQVKLGEMGHEVADALKGCRNYEKLKGVYRGDGEGPDAPGIFLTNLSGGTSSAGLSGHVTAAMQAVQLTIGYMEDFDAYKKVYTTWLAWQKYYPEEKQRLEEIIDNAEEDEDVSKEEQQLEELEEKNERFTDIIKEVTEVLGTSGRGGRSGVVTAMEDASKKLKADIDARMSDATNRLHTLYEDAVSLEKAAKLAHQSLNTVIAKMDNLKAKGDSWQGAISSLDAGDVKTSMQSDYDNKSKELDKGKIRILQEYLANGKAYAMELQNDIAPVKAVGFAMKEAQGKSSYASYLNNYWNNNAAYRTTTQPFSNRPFKGGSKFSVSEWVKNANDTEALKDPTFTVYLIDSFGGQPGTGKWQKMNLETYQQRWDKTVTTADEFFQYLERICPKSDADGKDQSSAAKDTKKDLLNKGKNADFGASGLPAGRSMAGSGNSKGFQSTDRDADDKTVSKNAKENSKTSANFLDNIGALLTKGRDKLYLAEYANKMFSYYTVDKPDGGEVKKTLSGYRFSEKNNYLYKSEVEYILWGNAEPSKNVESTLATIFGIRFLLNSIYAFTGDPEIRSVSLALATSIAGWTGFGVPLVQSVIILAFALAESALDLTLLKEGESIPIYKSQKTWTIKPSGIGREAANEVKQRIGQAINDGVKNLENRIFDELNGLTADTVSQFNTTLTKFGNEKVDDIISVASATVLTPVEEQIVGLVNVVTPDPGAIEGKISAALDGVQRSVEGEPDSVLKTAKLQAISIFRSGYLNDLAGVIRGLQNQGRSAVDISNAIMDKLNAAQKGMETSLKSTVSTAVNGLTDELQASIDAGSEKLQEEVSEKVDQYLMRIDCGVSFAELPETEESKKVRTSGRDALTMDYSEYLWMFIAVTSVSDEQERKMLGRIGNLIEKNLTMETHECPSTADHFAMDGAYTFVGIEATADLRTTFFSMPVPTAGGGSVTYGAETFPVTYRGVLGY